MHNIEHYSIKFEGYHYDQFMRICNLKSAVLLIRLQKL